MANAPKLTTEDLLYEGVPKINAAIDNANEALQITSIFQEKLNEPVPIEKIAFTVQSKNLFNKESVLDNYLLNGTNGKVDPFPGNCASDWIPIQPSSRYTVNYAYGYAWYTAGKEYISGANNAQNAGYTITAPINARYIRLNVNMSQKGIFQLEQGAKATDYVPYSLAIDNRYIDYVPLVVDGESVKNRTIDSTKCNFFVESKNLFDLSKVIDDVVLNGTNGKADQYPGNCYLDKYIAVTPGEQLVANKLFNYAFYNPNKMFIVGVNNSTAGTVITAPSGSKFLRIGTGKGNKTTFQIERGALVTDFEKYLGDTLDEKLLNYEKIKNELTSSSFTRLKWNVLGDSITDAKMYQTKVAAKLSIPTVRHYGVPGTCLAERDGVVDSASSMVNRYVNMDNDADIITVMGGTNDFDGVPISSTNKYDKKTYKGALRVLIEGLLNKYPGKYIVFMTPPQRYKNGYGVNDENINVNGIGHSVKDYADAMLEICSYYSIPCVDTFEKCGWSKANIGMFAPDGVHPNVIGHERIAALLISKLREIVY
ncbi:SGNH/GDSL hydrolase family protein [Bacillus mobilis]|uniref:SGNH/GDSL hydrolase family protein n=1 Tax=Bacillus mobilis TaxID=2026190 RepID=UPI002E1E0F67|nr:SGNH/GDSL hydrolase family protein [Bacillus mobilis]